MREYVILGCVAGAVACGGGRAAIQDSLRGDTTAVPGRPAIAVAPLPTESIASRARAIPRGGSARPDSRTSPTGGAKTSGGGAAKGTPAVGGTKSAGAGTGGTTTATTPPSPAGPDSIRGTVSIVGTDRDRHVMVAPVAGGRRVEITGPMAPLIGHAAGADVSVTGKRAGTLLEAARFVVKTVDCAAALDGTLRTEGSTLYIITADGTRTRIVMPPPPLLGHDGARVWITGDPSRGVASYGFIDPPR